MKIALFGYGKMGKMIDELATAAGDEVVLKIDIDNRASLTPQQLQAADVAIEFTRPESAFENITFSLKAGVPIVCGTTGWLDRLDEVLDICQSADSAFLYASNFSLGVNLFFALNEQLAKMMAPFEQYRPAMEEIHHTQKLDAPSGTAITLAEGILPQYPQIDGWVNEASDSGAALPIVSKRIDKVPGTHEIIYRSEVDEIAIKHTAHSRVGFAKGALVAARWLIDKKGFFGMKDVLSNEGPA